MATKAGTRKRASTVKAKAQRSTVSGAPQAGEPGQPEVAIGRQVRDLRVRMQIPSHTLAERARISQALLSRLEHGKVSPSLDTLSRLASSLGVPLTSLFLQLQPRNAASLIKAGAGQQVERAGTAAGQRYTALGMPLEGRIQVEPYLITIDRDTVPHPSFQHEGVEMIHMLEGALAYRHGNASYNLAAGDTLFFDARYPHGPERFDKVPARFLSVISYVRD